MALDGLRFRFLLNGKRRARWHEVRYVEWSPGFLWFVIRTHGDERLRVSAGLWELGELAQALLTHLARDQFSDAAHERLVLTAAGKAPALFE